MDFQPSYKSILHSALAELFRSSSAMLLSLMMWSTPTRKARRGTLCSPIWKCSSKVPDGVCSPPHQPATLAPTSASTAVVGFPPASTFTSAGNTEGSTTTTTCVVFTYSTYCGRHLPHLLQLWSHRPFRMRVPCSEEESSSGPRQPSTPWPTEGCCYQSWLCELHHHGRDFRGRASPHMYVFPKWAPRHHSLWFWCYSWFH
jgi:hypothetical protein